MSDVRRGGRTERLPIKLVLPKQGKERTVPAGWVETQTVPRCRRCVS